MNTLGLSLIEILVALSVLAIGAVGLVAMQLSTLKLAQQTSINARLLHVAESELQQRLLGVASGSACSALTTAELEGIDCTVTSSGCSTSLSGFDCQVERAGLPRRITVTASIADRGSVALSGVTRLDGGP